VQLIRREILAADQVRLSVDRCSYTFHRLRPGVLLITAAGQEYGELGRAAIGEVAVEAALHPPIRLFFDLAALSHVTNSVSEDWTGWFRSNQACIRRSDVLVGSLLVQLTVTVSQLFSRVGDQMRIHTERAAFDAALREAVPDHPRR
jgi:hypothetical protein